MLFMCKIAGLFLRESLLKFLVTIVAIVAVSSSTAFAAVEIKLKGGRPDPMPMAIPVFIGNSGMERQYGEEIAKIIGDDLESSGFFRIIDKNAYISGIRDFSSSPKFSDWRAINSQVLVTGRITVQNNNKIQAEFRLWDVVAQKQMTGLKFYASLANKRRIGHLIADAIYYRLTGEKGYFDSKVVFISESGSKDKRVKRLSIMDQDGYNVKSLTDGNSLVLTPRFSPNSQEITYMSYKGGRPRVYLYNLRTNQKEIIGDFPGMTFSPRFSPDGLKIIMSLQSNDNANIYTMDLRNRSTTRLTKTQAIDTAPSFSPDGNKVVFESDRDGSQQIYTMNADGSGQKRISFGQGRYSTPVWSPKGNLIAFTKMLKGRFLIGVMRPDGSGERIITEGYHNEGPTWAPNGQTLMFFRETPGANGGPKLWSVNISGYNERKINTPSFASDPAWSPLLK